MALSLKYKLLDKAESQAHAQRGEGDPETSTVKGYSYPPPPPDVPRLSYEKGRVVTILPAAPGSPEPPAPPPPQGERHRQSNAHQQDFRSSGHVTHLKEHYRQEKHTLDNYDNELLLLVQHRHH